MSNVWASAIVRREFLKLGSLSAISLAAGTHWLQAAESSDPYGGFKMTIQSYSLRGFDAKTALSHTKTLGLSYWEAWPRHIPMGTVPKHIQEQKALLADAGVTLLGYGVLPFDENETKTREAFDFASEMGIPSLSANPKKTDATFDLLDRMVEEYGVAIAIHNHGPGSLYDKIDDVVERVKDRHPKIGACVDTGHYLRSDEDPVEAIERLGERVFGVHLKDVKSFTSEQDAQKFLDDAGQKEGRIRDNKIMTILGQGDLDVVGCLRSLRALDYNHALSLEYEENKDNPLSDIEVCLDTVRKAVAKLG